MNETFQEFINLIVKHESRGSYNAYNYIFKHPYTQKTIIGGGFNVDRTCDPIFPGKPICEMTIEEIQQEQNNNRLYAVGKWQIISETLEMAIKYLKLDSNEIFNETVQDKLLYFFIYKKRPSIGDYITCQFDDINRVLIDISKEWASIGVPIDMKGYRCLVKKDESYYKGTCNKAYIKSNKVRLILEELRYQYLISLN